MAMADSASDDRVPMAFRRLSDSPRKTAGKHHKLTGIVLLAIASLSAGIAQAVDKKSAPYFGFEDAFDYDHPVESEMRLKAFAAQAEAAGDKVTEAEILTQVARSEGLEKKFAEAHANLDRAIALGIHNGRASIRISIERGRLYRLAGYTGKAAVYFRDAFEKAKATHQDYLMLDSVHMIALNEPFDTSRNWVQRGLKMAAQSRDPKTLHWVAILNNNMGVAYLDRRDYADAIRCFKSAFAAYRAQHSDAGTVKAAEDAIRQAQDAEYSAAHPALKHSPNATTRPR